MFQFKMTSGKFRILNNVVGTRANCVKPHKFDHRYACGANTRCQISYYLPKRSLMKNLPMYYVFYLITSSH